MSPYTGYIQPIIDESLDYMHKHSLIWEPLYHIPEEMRISHHPDHSEIFSWKAIVAEITKDEFAAFEQKIGFLLPESYKVFLSYKHFIRLDFRHEAIFFRHTPLWADDYYSIYKEYGLNNTLGNGLVPFAWDADIGFFCFDTKTGTGDNEYKIVTYDHYNGFAPQEYPSLRAQATFPQFLKILTQRLRE